VRDLAFDGTSASGTGIHLTEHNDLVSRVPYMLFLFLGAVQAGGDVKMTGGYSIACDGRRRQPVHDGPMLLGNRLHGLGNSRELVAASEHRQHQPLEARGSLAAE
jgi:hypothetical protein